MVVFEWISNGNFIDDSQSNKKEKIKLEPLLERAVAFARAAFARDSPVLVLSAESKNTVYYLFL